MVVEASSEAVDDKDFLRNCIEVRLRQYRKILELGVKSPKDIVVISSLPRTDKGAIDRMRLKSYLHEETMTK